MRFGLFYEHQNPRPWREEAGGDAEPAVRLRLSIPDFARLVAEEVDPQELFFDGRFHVEGDFQVVSRLPEMFGQPPRF